MTLANTDLLQVVVDGIDTWVRYLGPIPGESIRTVVETGNGAAELDKLVATMQWWREAVERVRHRLTVEAELRTLAVMKDGREI